MEYQIAMLLKAHMCNYCNSLIGEKYGDCILTYHSYETLDEMAKIFHKIKSKYDGVITSGLIPHSYLQPMIEENEISTACFGFDVENTYRIILDQSIRRENFSLSRIGVDFIPEGEDLAQVIGNNEMPALVKVFQEWLKSIPMAGLHEAEQGIAKRYLERYQQGKIDFIVTYFYSTVLEMKKHGIDCFYLYPNEREIDHTFGAIEKSIQIRRSALPAVIRVELRPAKDDTTSDLIKKILELEQHVQKLLSDQGEGLVVNRRDYALEIYTDSHVLRRLTNGFKECFFRESLMERIDFSGTVGYGLASDFYHARSNAMDAGNYASNFQVRQMRSALLGEDEKLRHLEQTKAGSCVENVSPEWLMSVAQAAKLAPETIFKIMEALRAEGTCEISSAALIGRLGVSLRTANRFLVHLQQAGFAKLSGYRPVVGKGRPVAIYKVTLLDSEGEQIQKQISSTVWPR